MQEGAMKPRATSQSRKENQAGRGGQSVTFNQAASMMSISSLVQMDKRKDPSSVDIKGILLDMRKYRMGLIQTPDQLRFSYMAVLEGAKYIKGDATAQVPAASHSPLFIINMETVQVYLSGEDPVK